MDKWNKVKKWNKFNGRKLSLLPSNSHGQRLLASPITYKGTITSGTTSSSLTCSQGPDPCCITGPDDDACCAVGETCVDRNTCGPIVGPGPTTQPIDFWKVALKAGVEYSITVRRVDCEFDPVSFLYSGDSCANDFDALTLEVESDDELEPACPGPFEDPFYTFVPSIDGISVFTLGKYSKGVWG